jgi:hypothetical protein
MRTTALSQVSTPVRAPTADAIATPANAANVNWAAPRSNQKVMSKVGRPKTNQKWKAMVGHHQHHEGEEHERGPVRGTGTRGRR